MDIEGAEALAISILSPEVAAKIRFFYIECNHVNHLGRLSQIAVAEAMRRLGYTVQDWGDAKTFCSRLSP